MDEKERVAVFEAQTVNVRDLQRAWSQENRHLNDLIRTQNSAGVHVTTKILGVLYCALAEAIFSKVIHLPNGFELAEIEQIKQEHTKKGVKPGWVKCVNLASSRLNGSPFTNVDAVRSTVNALIDKWIYDPSVLRNKLAHGQWSIALNSGNTAVNLQLTQEIANLNAVDLARRELALKKLSRVVEDMVISPHTAHLRDFGTHLSELTGDLSKMASWTMADKTAILQRKPKKKPTT
jgi:hypothetical protein